MCVRPCMQEEIASPSLEASPNLALSEIRSRARQLAQEEARLKLTSLVYDLQLDSEALIRDRMEQDSHFRRRMGKLPSRFRIESRRTGADYVSLQLSLPFRGPKGLYALACRYSQ